MYFYQLFIILNCFESKHGLLLGLKSLVKFKFTISLTFTNTCKQLGNFERSLDFQIDILNKDL